MKGNYVLLMKLYKSQHISTGKLGRLYFTRGCYAYVGSALNGIEVRVNRHFKSNKRHHWHIDYLLDKASIYEVFVIPKQEKLECKIALALGREFNCISRFGSSDCRCPGHLFYSSRKDRLSMRTAGILTDLGVTFLRYPVPVPKSTPLFPVILYRP